ncbi:hypothetical protein JCM16303_005168 [Sporobolomyces ruberrimus]
MVSPPAPPPPPPGQPSLPAGSSIGKASSEMGTSSKPKTRNRNRKKPLKAAPDGAPPPTPSLPTASTSKQPSAHPDRTSFPWRGSGRGRGRGGLTSNAGVGSSGRKGENGAARGYSTVAGSSTAKRDGAETGAKVQKKPLFQSAQAGTSRRGIQTDAGPPKPPLDSTPAPPSTSASRRGGGPNRGGGGRGRGRGKGRSATNGGDRGKALLERVQSIAGEADLHAQIQSLYDVQRPSPESIAAREHLIAELTDYLNRERFHWGHPHSPASMPLSIEPFGSTRFGLGTSASDLDLCLLDPYRPNGFEDKWFSSRKEHMQDLPDIYQMNKIGNSLYRAGLDKINPIPDAAVPICKFEVEIDGQTIQADLNTNERLGVYNSRLLNSYCNIHPLVRPLSVFVKFWASQRGLNNPSGDRDGIVTFSSYTLILLVISYLQKIAVLPNLQDEELITSTATERSRFFSTPKAYSRRGKLKHLIRSVGWDVTFVECDQAPPGFALRETDLVELARGFFHYFGEEFDMETDVVSIANGAPFAREREFGQRVAPVSGPDGVREPGNPEDIQGSRAERVRQDLEDLALEAFAEEQQARAGGGAAQVDDPRAELDAIAQAQSELDQEREKANEARSRIRAASTGSSSPIPYGDFSEPEKWTEHMLVVQDPFILTRNCAGNVQPDWVEELRIQMRRARDLIDSKAPLSTICLHHYSDPDYLPLAFAKRRAKAAERRKKQQDALDDRVRQEALAQAQTKQDAGTDADAKEGPGDVELLPELSTEREGAEGQRDDEVACLLPAGSGGITATEGDEDGVLKAGE